MEASMTHTSQNCNCGECGRAYSLSDSHKNPHLCPPCLDKRLSGAKHPKSEVLAVVLALIFGTLGMLYVKRFVLSLGFGWLAVCVLVVILSALSNLPEETTGTIVGGYVFFFRLVVLPNLGS